MKGIMFIEPLFNAVIEKRKDQTRRVIKEDPAYLINSILINNMGAYPAKDDLFLAIMEVGERHIKPRYKKGERVYLKEPYIEVPYAGSNAYRYTYAFDMAVDERKPVGFKNKMFMPESAARYFIEITDVGVERVQDISEVDAISEGIMVYGEDWVHKMFPVYATNYLLWELTNAECPIEIKPPLGPSPKQRFEKLHNSINKPPYDWDSNPFNWVYGLKLIT